VSDLTVVFITANVVPEEFAYAVEQQLIEATSVSAAHNGRYAPIISVSKKPMQFGENICVGDTPRSHLNIYRQALIGAKAAKTNYIAIAEDDVLYSPEHFKHRSQPGKFAYNLAYWNIYTWSKPAVFSWKGRRNLGQLICERDLFIRVIEERFLRWPDDSKINLGLWAEPGKYERQLDVSVQQTEEFWTSPPNVVFSHETALSYENLGHRKRLGELRATELPDWGQAEAVRSLYR
jgi:hypothetical protein